MERDAMSDQQPSARQMPGPLTRYLTEDHRHLDRLFASAVAAADAGHVDHAAYGRFRAGLLRHIGMEEKILLPAVQRIAGGKPLAIAARLRLDHAAKAALLMPSPTAGILDTIQTILATHNLLEEGPDGLYERCDSLAALESDALAARLREAPEIKVTPYSDSTAVMTTVRRALQRAGYVARL